MPFVYQPLFLHLVYIAQMFCRKNKDTHFLVEGIKRYKTIKTMHKEDNFRLKKALREIKK